MQLAVFDIIIRLSLAVLIGTIVGIEREYRHRTAGIKTHIMVCLGATVVSLVQIEMTSQALLLGSLTEQNANIINADNARLTAQVISGVGFLGAGCILRNKNENVVVGLTTAATLWLTACVGIAIGMGYYAISITTAVIVIIVLFVLRFIVDKIKIRKLSKNTNYNNSEQL